MLRLIITKQPTPKPTILHTALHNHPIEVQHNASSHLSTYNMKSGKTESCPTETPVPRSATLPYFSQTMRSKLSRLFPQYSRYCSSKIAYYHHKSGSRRIIRIQGGVITWRRLSPRARSRSRPAICNPPSPRPVARTMSQ